MKGPSSSRKLTQLDPIQRIEGMPLAPGWTPAGARTVLHFLEDHGTGAWATTVPLTFAMTSGILAVLVLDDPEPLRTWIVGPAALALGALVFAFLHLKRLGAVKYASSPHVSLAKVVRQFQDGSRRVPQMEAIGYALALAVVAWQAPYALVSCLPFLPLPALDWRRARRDAPTLAARAADLEIAEASAPVWDGKETSAAGPDPALEDPAMRARAVMRSMGASTWARAVPFVAAVVAGIALAALRWEKAEIARWILGPGILGLSAIYAVAVASVIWNATRQSFYAPGVNYSRALRAHLRWLGGNALVEAGAYAAGAAVVLLWFPDSAPVMLPFLALPVLDWWLTRRQIPGWEAEIASFEAWLAGRGRQTAEDL